MNETRKHEVAGLLAYALHPLLFKFFDVLPSSLEQRKTYMHYLRNSVPLSIFNFEIENDCVMEDIEALVYARRNNKRICDKTVFTDVSKFLRSVCVAWRLCLDNSENPFEDVPPPFTYDRDDIALYLMEGVKFRDSADPRKNYYRWELLRKSLRAKLNRTITKLCDMLLPLQLRHAQARTELEQPLQTINRESQDPSEPTSPVSDSSTRSSRSVGPMKGNNGESRKRKRGPLDDSDSSSDEGNEERNRAKSKVHSKRDALEIKQVNREELFAKLPPTLVKRKCLLTMQL